MNDTISIDVALTNEEGEVKSYLRHDRHKGFIPMSKDLYENLYLSQNNGKVKS